MVKDGNPEQQHWGDTFGIRNGRHRDEYYCLHPEVPGWVYTRTCIYAHNILGK